MIKHEKYCYRNPNRFCEYCKNKGFTEEWLAGDGVNEPAYFSDPIPCPYCSKEDKDLTQRLKDYDTYLNTKSPN